MEERTIDYVFDIDGTLANAAHRLHFIKQPAEQMRDHVVPDFKPDWDSFLCDEQVARDTPIVEIWNILFSLASQDRNRIIFITGRPEAQRTTTIDWLTDMNCPSRSKSAAYLKIYREGPTVYMRKDGDRRPSDVVKRELLQQARRDGYMPALVFEDRKNDTAMWRSEGLLCCQVAEGNY